MRIQRLLFVALLITGSVFGQDSSTVAANAKGGIYKTVGFNLSNVSGLGLSYGINTTGLSRIRITAGYISIDKKSSYSIGGELHYELTRGSGFRVFVGPGFQVVGGTEKTPSWALGFGVGSELPLTGTSIFDNVSAGGTLYYPTFWLGSGNVSLGGSCFISYNF